MKNIFFSLIILLSGVLSAQECKIDLHLLAQPDNNMIQFNKFGQSRLFKIVLSDGFDTTVNKEIIDQLSQWFLNQNSSVSTVDINDVKELDDSCHYLIIGLTGKLKDLSVFDLPVKINNDKCTLGPIELTDNADAIAIINEKARCSAIIGKSYAALRNMSSGRFLGLYDYYVLKKNKMSYLGNLKENKFIPGSLVDLALIRKENYFNEGIPSSFALFQHPERIANDPISGLFIKFLIDKYGTEKLREFYQCRDITEGFKIIYNVELPVVVAEWKSFILRNTE